MTELKPLGKCPLTSTGEWFGISFERKIVFITRVSRFNKIEALNQQLKEILDGSNFNWEQYFIFDMTKITDFDQSLLDKLTNAKFFYVDEKPEIDSYMAFAIDQSARTIEDKNTWIYILDDDNMLLPQFKDLAWQLDSNYPIIMFNINMPPISNGFCGIIEAPLKYGEALFHVDSANYVVQRKVFDQISHFNSVKSKWHDGIFIQKALKLEMPIKYINKVYGQHNEASTLKNYKKIGEEQ